MTKFNELFPLQVVINLDKRPDRLGLCKKELAKINSNPIRKTGVLYDKTTNTWWNGAIGCLISHYEILEGAAYLGVNVFIFEDDITFITENPLNILRQACKELDGMNWDMFYMGGNLLKPAYQVEEHLAKLTHCQSTVAYGVNKKFTRELLLKMNLNNVTKPIDMIYADDIIPKHNCFITIPMMIIQRDSYSDIEGGEVKYSDYLEKRYWENLKKEYP